MLPLGAAKAVDASASRETTDEEPNIVLLVLRGRIDSRMPESYRMYLGSKLSPFISGVLMILLVWTKGKPGRLCKSSGRLFLATIIVALVSFKVYCVRGITVMRYHVTLSLGACSAVAS